MEALRIGNAIGLLRFDTTWFRMHVGALAKLVACARALEVSKRAFEARLKQDFGPKDRDSARVFLLRHARPRSARPASPFDPELTDFLAACRSLRFMDYSNIARTKAQDRERMERYSADDAPPPLAHRFANAGRVRLPAPLGEVAEWTFRNQLTSEFLNHRVGKRGVPSHGARQPFDAIFSYRAGRKRVDAYYDPEVGRAYEIARTSGAPVPRASVRTIQLFACYERVQWRYRHSGFYDTLLLDAGHIIGNIERIARAHGWRMDRCSTPELQPGVSRPFVSESFLEIDLVPQN